MIRLIMLLGLAIGFCESSLADWPNFQGPSRKGFSDEQGLQLENWDQQSPKVAWRKTLNKGFGGAAIFGNEVFITDRLPSEADQLFCLDLTDGSEKWKYSYEHKGSLPFPGTRGVPLITEEAVYFISGFGQIHRVNRQTKQADWVISLQTQYDAPPPKWGWAQSPVLAGEILIIPAMSPSVGLLGIDAKTGEELWRTEGVGSSHSTPTILNLHGVEQAVFVASVTADKVGTTISVDPQTGKLLWKTHLYYNKYPIPFATKLSDDQLFLTGGYGNGSCILKVSDTWEVTKVVEISQGSQLHPPMVIDNHIYIMANENDNYKGTKRTTGGLTCMNMKGEVLWNTGEKPFMGRGNLISVEGKLLIQDGETGYLRLIEPSPKGYQEIGIFDAFGKKDATDAIIKKQEGRKRIKIPDLQFWSPMAIANSHLVLRGQENIVCLKLK